MDQDTRNHLQRATQQVRRILEEEFAEQLEGTFDVLPSGEIFPEPGKHLDARHRLVRQKLVDAIEHMKAGGQTAKEAIAQFMREVAFTFLNRFVALRMLEARGILQECVSHGDESSGFKEFCGLAPGLSSLDGGGYRLYLESLFDELSVEVKVLFDRRDVASLLWPRRAALTHVLDVLAKPELSGVWTEDETIGWVYQYYNDPAERKKMRDESAAPRNSRELAVRNQFFTPRYVVEFLTDNTLGRIWYEMAKGETRLAEQCRYLVRRPTEIFLGEGEDAPEPATSDTEETLGQEDLLKQPVYIPHRPVKDPREIRLLDPACGSMHFGLYAFDLFEAIYEEAWDKGLCPALQEAYPNKADYLRDVPRLIIEHNIHGVDIDPRATQIAGLSLWLRAQKAWQDIPAADRPRIQRSNIVCAEPMPGSPEMLEEFVATLDPPLLGEFVKNVFEKMELAGEAGTLLKIEEEIRSDINDARKEARRLKDDLFGQSNVIDEDFFGTAEERIYTALWEYAESAVAGDYQRRLFAEDAAHGFAFIDLCRKRYDAVVMNPPFGLFTKETLSYAKRDFSESSNDIYAAFVERAVRLVGTEGSVGVISSRLGFFLEGLKKWRLRLMGENSALRVIADLGYGVLDALVETAAYVLDKNTRDPSVFAVSALAAKDKGQVVSQTIQSLREGCSRSDLHVSRLDSLRKLPGSVLAYWLCQSFLGTIGKIQSVDAAEVSVFSGLQTDDDFRFLRLWWECPNGEIDIRWFPFAKGGEYQPFADNLHLAVNWHEEGREMKEFVASKYVNWSRHIKNTDRYFISGLTYSERTTSDISVRSLPPGAIFSVSGPVLQCGDQRQLLTAWALFNTRVGRSLVEMAVGSGDTSKSGTAARHYRTGILSSTPMPTLDSFQTDEVESSLQTLFHENAWLQLAEETHRHYSLSDQSTGTLEHLVKTLWEEELERFASASQASSKIETVFNHAFNLSQEEVTALAGAHPSEYTTTISDEQLKQAIDAACEGEAAVCEFALKSGVHSRSATKKTFYFSRELELISAATKSRPDDLSQKLSKATALWHRRRGSQVEKVILNAVGGVLGRWDIRYATGERQPPELPDPFDPLPVCPPGMLQNADGLPAAPNDVPGDYPLRLNWSGILVDDEGHAEDIVARVQDALTVIWGDRSAAIEQEACEILGIRSLRDYFQSKKGFFPDHIKRYCKSRRKAPIYWQLATPSGSYSVWLYYHRFTKDTFFSVVELVQDKLKHERQKLSRVQGEAGADPAASQRKSIESQENFVAELATMAEDVVRVAPLWNPNLNDGVIINSAPLWRLVPQNKSWQKECKKVWDKLVEGDYDWAHLAMHLWPERVVPKCQNDASLAIAHGLDEVFWEQDDRDRLQPKDQPEGGWDPIVKQLVEERTSPAVKAALKSLLDAPSPAAKTTRPKKSKAR